VARVGDPEPGLEVDGGNRRTRERVIPALEDPGPTPGPVSQDERRWRLGYVPSSQDARYLACSSVSSSIAMPIVASLRRAISLSISSGTG
jgi:hypothetical protein